MDGDPLKELDSLLAQMEDVLIQMYALAARSASDSCYGDGEREILQGELVKLRGQLDALAEEIHQRGWTQ